MYALDKTFSILWQGDGIQYVTLYLPFGIPRILNGKGHSLLHISPLAYSIGINHFFIFWLGFLCTYHWEDRVRWITQGGAGMGDEIAGLRGGVGMEHIHVSYEEKT
ncbi:hypothetical protein ACJX0J_019537 [Zea mays]